jgi:hypothetical protein
LDFFVSFVPSCETGLEKFENGPLPHDQDSGMAAGIRHAALKSDPVRASSDPRRPQETL